MLEEAKPSLVIRDVQAWTPAGTESKKPRRRGVFALRINSSAMMTDQVNAYNRSKHQVRSWHKLARQVNTPPVHSERRNWSRHHASFRTNGTRHKINTPYTSAITAPTPMPAGVP